MVPVSVVGQRLTCRRPDTTGDSFCYASTSLDIIYYSRSVVIFLPPICLHPLPSRHLLQFFGSFLDGSSFVDMNG